jgi:hypothetical protein
MVKKSAPGYILIVILFFAAVVFVISAAVLNLGSFGLKVNRGSVNSLSALQVAEAGVNYYMWHLAHDKNDYKDGNATPSASPYGPYFHDFMDSSGNVIGFFTLYVTPPVLGSNLVTIKSTGQLNDGPEQRTILAMIGIPSFTQYVLLSDFEMWIKEGEIMNGPLHSNRGIHFDGVNNGIVSAAVATYKPAPLFGGDGQDHPGVWGTGGPQSQWVFPVPAVDFSKVTQDLSVLKAQAVSGGYYFEKTNKAGYYFLFKTNGTIDVYKVTQENNNGLSKDFFQTINYPVDGIIFVEDNVWVEGVVKGKVTLASGRFPDSSSTRTDVTIAGNLTYDAKDCSNMLGLIAQRDILVAAYSPDFLEVDGALLAQKGHVWRKDFNNNIRDTITLFGSIATYDYWSWAYYDNHGDITSGYRHSVTTYDQCLALSSPPGFPTTGSYAILSWREIK